MKIVSVNVRMPREVVWKGMTVQTGIFKEPVDGPVAISKLNLAGDKQADLTVHGGSEKAVYAYPAEHYEYWRNELPQVSFSWGKFGENLTTEGLLEDTLCIGDRLRVGSAVLMATQPRMPCYKLDLRFDRDDMIKRFLTSGRSGFYFSVIEPGVVTVGSKVEILSRDPHRVTVVDIVRLYLGQTRDPELLQRATNVSALPDNWKAQLLLRGADGCGWQSFVARIHRYRKVDVVGSWSASRGCGRRAQNEVVELAAQLRSSNPHVGNPDLGFPRCAADPTILDGRSASSRSTSLGVPSGLAIPRAVMIIGPTSPALVSAISLTCEWYIHSTELMSPTAYNRNASDCSEALFSPLLRLCCRGCYGCARDLGFRFEPIFQIVAFFTPARLIQFVGASANLVFEAVLYRGATECRWFFRRRLLHENSLL